ncbi:MAG: hypothetical protein K0R62_777 [Nonomuraea muscovyensis]|nr:hypothetical protein [Nonomuraea muscovyensis]
MAAGVDHGHAVGSGGLDLVQLGVEDAPAVAGPDEGVAAGRAAAGAGRRQLDVLADPLQQRPRLAPHAEAVAQVAGVLQGDPERSRGQGSRAGVVRCGRLRRRAGGGPAGDVLRQFLDPVAAEDVGQVGGAAAGGGDDHAGQLPAQLGGQLPAAFGVAVVRVQRAAAALGRGNGQLGQQPQRRPADPREERPFEASEHQVRPGRPVRGTGVAAQQAHEPHPPAGVHREHQQPHDRRPGCALPLPVPPLLQQRPVPDAGRADRLARPAAQAEARLLAQPQVVGGQAALLQRAHEVDAAAGRGRLVLGQRVRRTRGQAEAAGDAAVEKVGGESGHEPTFPGLRTPAGSKAALIRRSRST